MWCQHTIQTQQLVIGKQRMLEHLKRVVDIPTVGVITLELDFENWIFNWEDIEFDRIIKWRKRCLD